MERKCALEIGVLNGSALSRYRMVFSKNRQRRIDARDQPIDTLACAAVNPDIPVSPAPLCRRHPWIMGGIPNARARAPECSPQTSELSLGAQCSYASPGRAC